MNRVRLVSIWLVVLVGTAYALTGDILEQPAIPANFREQAEEALQDRFFLLGTWESVPRTPDGGLNWEHRGERGDKERAWMLNRHEFILYLALAWQESGDERYRDKGNALLTDWIQANPYPNRLTFSPSWRALEVARRINNAWLHVAAIPGFLDPETHSLMLSSLPDHADSLMEHASFWGGNHLITEKLALLTLAVTFPDLEDAGQWQEHAIEVLTEQFMEQTYPDGSYKELSNHYQRVVLFNARQFLKLLAEVDPEFRQREVYHRIEKMWDFFAGVTKPDGYGPLSNASDRELNALHLEEVWNFHDRPDWLAIATQGARGTIPEGSPSRHFPWAGQVILRSNWGPRADWIYFDAGPYGTAHQHIDRFHVSASIKGRQVLTDGGRYTYQPGMWRDYFKGPASHNLILLDGEPARQETREVPEPLPVTFQETDIASFTGARTQFSDEGAFPNLQAPATWTRSILYDQRGFALILDHLVTFRKHQLTANWHFHPEITNTEAPRYLRLVHPVEGLESVQQRGSESPPLGSFHSTDYNSREPAVLLRFSGKVDRPSTLVWCLQDPESPVVTIQLPDETEGPVVRLEILLDRQPAAEAVIRLYPEPELLEYTAF
ncbi:MAG: alginate lyase family protein [Puniceicoccaceae bacterium]